MSDRTLVTGFGPFLDVVDNPSGTLAKAAGRSCQVLDVSYDAVEDFIFHLDPNSFDRLLMLGVAPSRTHLCTELFARNTYGRIPDAQGRMRSGPIQSDQPLLLGTTLFGDEFLSDLLVHHRQVRMSLDAGSYLCNFTYFKVLAAFPTKQIGFLHVPTFHTISFEEQLAMIQELLASVESANSALAATA